MSRLTQPFGYIICHSVLLAFIFYGHQEKIEGLINISMGILWLKISISLLFLSDAMEKHHKGESPAVPTRLKAMIDCFIIFGLVYYGNPVTAVFYFIAIMIGYTFWEKVQKA